MTDKWYVFSNKTIKVILPEIRKLNSNIEGCSECNYAITSKSYQQSECGSLKCQHCYDKTKSRYYCNPCKEENGNFNHEKSKMFLDKAREKDLEKIKINCPDCKVEVIFTNIEEHIRKCPKKWKQCKICKNMCKTLENHKCQFNTKDPYIPETQCPTCNREVDDIKEHECLINWEKNCPFSCNDVNASNHEDLMKHREEAKLKHLDYAWAVIKSNGLDLLQDDSEENSEKSSKLYEKLVDHVKEALDIDSCLSDLKSELKELNKSIKLENELYNHLLDTVKSQLEENFYTSYDGTILWRIDKWERTMEKAKDGSKISIFSQPFYTSRFGYKLCLRLYPNGDSTAQNTAMSLFLVIMRGNYDNVLKWPFKQKVTFMLLDQEFKNNHIDAFVPTDSSPSFAKPRFEMNVPAGSSYFIKLCDMSQYKYVKDDIVFIRCIIDCSDIPD